MVEFFRTIMGQRFYETTMPTLVRELARLNANLEAVLVRLSPPSTAPGQSGPPTGACPRCGSPLERSNALSRRDNTSDICSPCGTDEACLDSGLRTEPARRVLPTWPWPRG